MTFTTYTYAITRKNEEDATVSEVVKTVETLEAAKAVQNKLYREALSNSTDDYYVIVEIANKVVKNV